MVESGGVVSASVAVSQSYMISSDINNIENYSRWGNDLVVELSSGHTVRINSFFINGPAFHLLMLVANGMRMQVDFSHALVGGGDGVQDNRIVYQQVNESASVKKLLGILGGAAAAGAGIAAAVRDDDSGSRGIAGQRPAKPVVEAKDDSDLDSTARLIGSGEHTRDSTPTFAGKGAVAGGTVMICINGGAPVYVHVNEDGTWNYTPDHKLSDGDYNVRIIQIDRSGLASKETVLEFTVDTKSPVAPTLEKVEDNVSPDAPVLDKDEKWSQPPGKSVIEKGGVTNDYAPVFSGAGEAGSVITIYDEKDHVIGSGLVDKEGKWSVKLKTPIGDGHHDLYITATDKAGNVSDKSSVFPIDIDTKLPGQLDLRNIEIYNHISDEKPVEKNKQGECVTNSLCPVFRCKVGGVDAVWIEIMDVNNTVAALVKVEKDGSWKWQPNEDLTSGYRNYQFRAVDSAGNRGPLIKSPWINIGAEKADAFDALALPNSPDNGEQHGSAGILRLEDADRANSKKGGGLSVQSGPELFANHLCDVSYGHGSDFETDPLSQWQGAMPGHAGGMEMETCAQAFTAGRSDGSVTDLRMGEDAGHGVDFAAEQAASGGNGWGNHSVAGHCDAVMSAGASRADAAPQDGAGETRCGFSD